MKKIFIITALIGIGLGTWSCSEEKLKPNSIFVDPLLVQTPFDNWLFREFVAPYNIEVVYRLVPNALDPNFEVVPSTIESAKIMSVLMKHLYMDLYAQEAPEGVVFIQKYLPKQLLYVGSGAWDVQGQTTILGQASGGKSMVLFALNDLYLDKTDPAHPKLFLKDYAHPNGSNENLASRLLMGYFHTIHHEFGHILHQMETYGKAWEEMSIGSYVGENWDDIPSEQDARDAGFISRYAQSQPQEDFVETFSYYICYTAQEWNEILSVTSPDGRDKINDKVAYVDNYLRNKWGMNLDSLRAAILLRAEQLDLLEYENLN